MKITDIQIEKFIKIYEEEYKEKLSYTEARRLASLLLNLMKILLT